MKRDATSKTTSKPASSRTKCFSHFHMTAAEYGLWTYARDVSHNSGIFYASSRAIAKAFAGMTKSKVHRTSHSLIKKGWFVVVEPSHPSPHGTWTSNVVRPLSHDEWTAIYSEAECAAPESPVPQTGHVPPEGQPVPQAKQPVPKSRATCPTGGMKSDNDLEGSREEREKIPALLSPEEADKSRAKIARDIGADADKKTPPDVPKFQAARSRQGKAELGRLLKEGYTQNQLQAAVWSLADSWNSTIRWEKPRPRQIDFFLDNLEGEAAAIKKLWDEREEKERQYAAIPVQPLGFVGPEKEEEEEGVDVELFS
jgi:hypothetical protein